MAKLTPPSPKHLAKRRDFFLAHSEMPNARWEVFNLTNQIINRNYTERKIDQFEYTRLMDELDRTQGWPVKKESEMVRLGKKMGLNV